MGRRKQLPDHSGGIPLHHEFFSDQKIEEIRDRYGKLPDEAQNIVSLAELKLCATQLRVQQIRAMNGTVTLSFDPNSPVTEDQLKRAAKHSAYTIRQISARSLVVRIKRLKNAEKINHVKNILQGFR